MLLPSASTASTVDDIVGRPAPVVARPNAPFLLVHNIGRGGSWEVRDEGLERPTWIPSFDNYPLVPGAGYVRQRSDKMADPEREELSALVEIMKRDGRKILSKSLGYCKAHDCVAPNSTQRGTLYARAWPEILPPLEAGKLAIEKVDSAKQTAVFLGYCADGHVPAPDPRLLERQHRANIAAILAIKADKQLPADLKREQVREAVIAARRELTAARPWDPDYVPAPADLAALDRLDPDYEPPKKRKGGDDGSR